MKLGYKYLITWCEMVLDLWNYNVSIFTKSLLTLDMITGKNGNFGYRAVKLWNMLYFWKHLIINLLNKTRIVFVDYLYTLDFLAFIKWKSTYYIFECVSYTPVNASFDSTSKSHKGDRQSQNSCHFTTSKFIRSLR